MTVHLKIDMVSDVACPWCAVGLFALQQALKELDTEVSAELNFMPFELNPTMAPEGEDAIAYLGKKYGASPEQQARTREMIAARGAEVGFHFAPEGRGRIYNTFDAHRLLTWAGTLGWEAQHKLKVALLEAYQGRAEPINDPEVLLHAVDQAGLPHDDAHTVLHSEAYAQAVREGEQWAQQIGIQSVPTFIVNDQYMITGGQPVEVFTQSLREIAAEAAA
jgi:predicted DsbA family dithiol-disulfide isomerase